MSFLFNWPEWSPQLVSEIRTQLEHIINKQLPPIPILLDKISIHELSFGDQPPKLKFEKLNELKETFVSTQFYFSYHGGFKISIRTKVQLNRLVGTKKGYVSPYERSLLQSDVPLELPVIVGVSSIRLDGRVRIDISMSSPLDKVKKQRTKIGILLLNDPLEGIQVDTIVDDELPSFVKQSLDKIINFGAKTAIKQFMQKPIEIELPDA